MDIRRRCVSISENVDPVDCGSADRRELDQHWGACDGAADEAELGATEKYALGACEGIMLGAIEGNALSSVSAPEWLGLEMKCDGTGAHSRIRVGPG